MNEITDNMREALALLTVAQVAELTQMSKDWVFQEVEKGRIPHLRLGRNIRFRPLDLQAYMAGEYVPPNQ